MNYADFKKDIFKNKKIKRAYEDMDKNKDWVEDLLRFLKKQTDKRELVNIKLASTIISQIIERLNKEWIDGERCYACGKLKDNQLSDICNDCYEKL